MQIPRDTHVELFQQAHAVADVPEETTVLFLIPTTPPTGEAEVIYQAPPDPTRMNYAALAAVGAQRLYEYRIIHRFAAYQDVDEAPFSAIATELRHEAQHARQFDLLGPKFHELDRILRDLVREHPSARYEGIPSERDANRAASAYASEHYPDDLEAMAEDDRFRQYTVEITSVEDLIEETVGMIRQLAERDQTDEHTGRPLGDVVDELAADAREWRDAVASGANRRVARNADQDGVVRLPTPPLNRRH